MTAYIRPLQVAAVPSWAALIALSAFVMWTEAQEKTDAVLAGRLATVETTTGRITMVPDGEFCLAEFFAAEDCEMRDAERPLTLAELVIHAGSRVTIQYSVEGGRRLARSIIVEPD